MNIVSIFELLAHTWHVDIAKQKRKYTGEDYDVHTKAVAQLYADYFPTDEIGIAAAHGHDLLEDCEQFGCNRVVMWGQINKLKPNKPHLVPLVFDIIIDLTHIYTAEAYPGMDRAERKQAEAKRLSQVRPASQSLKICDLIDNARTIVLYDEGFARMFVKEMRHLIDVMTKADPRLRTRAYESLREDFKKLGLTWDEPTL